MCKVHTLHICKSFVIVTFYLKGSCYSPNWAGKKIFYFVSPTENTKQHLSFSETEEVQVWNIYLVLKNDRSLSLLTHSNFLYNVLYKVLSSINDFARRFLHALILLLLYLFYIFIDEIMDSFLLCLIQLITDIGEKI